MLFRITGPQSIERLEPLVPRVVEGAVPLDPRSVGPLKGVESSANEKLDFVWETTCEMTMRDRHSQATVLNKLHNVVILEDKANLAFLQMRMNCPVLETFVASSPHDVHTWASKRWVDGADTPSGSVDGDWWVVKASAGNGGRDIWVLSSQNYHEVVEELPKSDILVIQKYVARPMLWKGKKKFHFRCYSVLRADMTALVYQMAYILTAGYNYEKSDDEKNSESSGADMMDPRRLITNLSVNKAIQNHPGQVPCRVSAEYPELYRSICAMWCEVAKACTPFMQEQISPYHFEFFGIDIIADRDGVCWLLEVNRLPGLESSIQNKAEEDIMYDEMMLSLLRIVLAPLVNEQEQEQGTEQTVGGMWDTVNRSSSSSSSSSSNTVGAPTFKNTFSWRAYTKKKEIRRSIVLSAVFEDDDGGGEGAGGSGGKGRGVGLLGEKQPSNDDTETETVFKRTEDTAKKVGKCGVLNCKEHAALRCSRCKKQTYCSAAHQKEDWSSHKRICKSAFLQKSRLQKERHITADSVAAASKSQGASGSGTGAVSSFADEDSGLRQSRCMFCGETVIMASEEDAQQHMRDCPALQEQLSSPDQFTIPKHLRDKGVTMADVHKQHEQEKKQQDKS